MKTAYLIAISAVVISGVLTLALQYCSRSLWEKVKHKISVSAGAVAALLLIAGRQPYAAALLFIFLIMKLILLIKRR